MFARANRAEEQRPWAIIRAREPFHPQDEFDIVPAVRRPICPTEE